ncbi:MAG: 23S rRNA (pseudouridine(1915)-N(3))-methyltransferase RlmH, partial [Selenomonadales bacterium]|nr:23S rRNA (pseudouridine(1915)-N(3))-methyltransferase RlmH [Selenomonadales bacterium]
MKITIVTAGKIKEKYLADGIKEFLKRLTPYANVKIVEIAEERMPDAPSDAGLVSEGQRREGLPPPHGAGSPHPRRKEPRADRTA